MKNRVISSLVIVLFLFGGRLFGAEEADYKNHLICYFKFDEGEYLQVYDSSPNKIVGSIKSEVNQEELWVDGVYGKALKFSQAWGQTHLYIPKNKLLNLTKGFTFSFWIKPDDDLKARRADLVSKKSERPGDTTAYLSGYRIQCFYRNIRLFLGFTDERKLLSSKDNPLTYGHWHHIAVTFDGKIARIYVNTKENNSLDVGAGKVLGTNTYPVVLGAYIAPPYYRFSGIMDDFRIYDIALTEKEIAEVATGN